MQNQDVQVSILVNVYLFYQYAINNSIYVLINIIIQKPPKKLKFMRKSNILQFKSQDSEISEDYMSSDQKNQKNINFPYQNIPLIKTRFQNFLEEIGDIKSIPVSLEQYRSDFSEAKVEKTIGLQEIYIILQNTIRKMTSNKREKKNWSKDDFILLLWIIEKYNSFQEKTIEQFVEEDWKHISSLIPGKDYHQCMFKWLGLKKNKHTEKFPWTETQENLLKSLVKQQNLNKWFEVSKQLYLYNTGFRVYRSPKQCRERWACYLNPKLKKGPWSPQQDIILLQKYLQIGKKWSNIAKILNGRTENAVKNRFNLILEKKEKNKLKLSDDDFIRNHIQNMQINSFMKTSDCTPKNIVFTDFTNQIDKNLFLFKEQILNIKQGGCQESNQWQTESNLSEIGYESDTNNEQKNTHFVTFKNLNFKELMALCQKLLPAEFDEENDEINYKLIAPTVKVQKKDFNENSHNQKFLDSPSTDLSDITFQYSQFQDQFSFNSFQN